QILDGEIKYSLEDLYKELKDAWYKNGYKKEQSEVQKNESFKPLFMFILLSAEDKSVQLLSEVFNNMPEKGVHEIQEAFKIEIDVARHIHMRKYLDLYTEYHGGMDMTLKLLNLWIQEFLDKFIKEEKDG